MASRETRGSACRNGEAAFLRRIGHESLTFPSSESINSLPLWKRFLWMGILCVLIVTCLIGIMVLAFSHFQSTDAQTVQIRTGALIGFGFLLAAVLIWTVFVYTKLGRLCSARRNERTGGEFIALAAATVSTSVERSVGPRERCPPTSAATNNTSTAVSRRVETSVTPIGRNLASTMNSTANNGNVSLVHQHEGVRVNGGGLFVAHEMQRVPISRGFQIERPRTIVDDRRTMRRFIETSQLPPAYRSLPLPQEYVQQGFSIIRNGNALFQPNNLQFIPASYGEIARIHSEGFQTRINHCRVSSQFLESRATLSPPPYRPPALFLGRASPPPAYDSIISRRTARYSESSNPPSYQSAPPSPVPGRRQSHYLTSPCSPLLHDEDAFGSEDRASFLSSSQLSLTQDGEVFVCETHSTILNSPVSSFGRDISPQTEDSVRHSNSSQLPLTPDDGVVHCHSETNSCFLSRSRSSMELDGELLHGDGEIFHCEGSTIASSGVGREDGSVGPVIYVYLGQAERR